LVYIGAKPLLRTGGLTQQKNTNIHDFEDSEANDDGCAEDANRSREAAITLWQRVTRSARKLDSTAVVDPVVIAEHAMSQIELYTPALVRTAAMLQLRQIAREVLRSLHKPNGKKARQSKGQERASEEAPTFPGDDFRLLQVRYPKAHVLGRPQGYALLDELTEADWNWNIDQLLNESGVKSAHASQLKRWGERLKGFIRKGAVVQLG
jgi:hypothetical protein